MKTLVFYALIALNIAIGCTLFARFGKEQTAVAQVGRPAEYLMVPGSVTGASDAFIYILDMSNGLLGAMVYNGSNGKFDIMPPIDLNRLMDPGAGNAPRNPVAPRR